MNFTLLLGDVRDQLATIDDGRVQCVVTSPPYWGLRDYGVEGQIGSEETLEEYIDVAVNVFRGARRALRNDGTLWLNMGDAYADDSKWGGRTGGKHVPELHGGGLIGRRRRRSGLKGKDLIGLPWMLAFALRADGWYLRSDIIWSKSNPMPESMKDRPTKAHEYLFLLSKRAKYFYDADAIAEPIAPATLPRYERATSDYEAPGQEAHNGFAVAPRENVRKKPPSGWDFEEHGRGKKVWRYSRENVDRVPRQRKGNAASFRGSGAYVEGRSHDNDALVDRGTIGNVPNMKGTRNKRTVWTIATQAFPEAHFATFPEDLVEPCILAGSRAGDLILDPFSGSGTTGVVALAHGRDYVGIELNAEYLEMSRRRLLSVAPMFTKEIAAPAPRGRRTSSAVGRSI